MRTFPDVSLVREPSSPAVYLVVGDTKFWITDPAEFDALGFRWDRVRVVEDGSLASLKESRLHAPPVTRPSDVFVDCGQDFDSLTGRWHYNCQSGASIIGRDVIVAGWLEARFDEATAPFVNRKDHGIEDIYYNIILDERFVDRMYGSNGLSTALLDVSFPGNPVSGVTLPFAAAQELGGVPRVTWDSWVMPHQGWNLHVELNAWHRDDTGALFGRHFKGRGTPPAHWVAPFTDDPGAFFPFDPLNPGGDAVLKAGDYILMRGTLWQDAAHYGAGAPPLPFDVGQFAGHGGWLEMHPPDWVAKVGNAPSPNARRTCKWFALITPGTAGTGSSVSDSIFPDFAPSAPSRYLRVREIRDNVDRRYTLDTSVRARSAVSRDDHVDVVATTAPTGAVKGRLKCSWVVGWRELDTADWVWIDDRLPTGAVAASDNETWNWATAKPAPFIGALCHQSAVVNSNWHQHYFYGATATMTVGAQDVLFAVVYLDEDNPPDEVMLQWHTSATGWEHRAYWGDNRIPWGLDNAAGRRRMGDLPRGGEWVRLEVKASDVGLANAVVDGMAFALWSGKASFDYCGVRAVQVQLRATVMPTTAEPAEPVSILVRTVDANTQAPVQCSVSYNNRVIGQSNAAFTYTFNRVGRKTLKVSRQGYPDTSVSVNVRVSP